MRNLLILTAAAAVAACGGTADTNNAAEANEAVGAAEAPALPDANAASANLAAPSGPIANAASNTAATAAAVPYRASGSEPFWSLTISGGQMAYHPADGPDITEPTGPKQPIANGYRYVGSQLTVEVTHDQCQDMAEQFYPDTVKVTVGGRTGSGCGG